VIESIFRIYSEIHESVHLQSKTLFIVTVEDLCRVWQN